MIQERHMVGVIILATLSLLIMSFQYFFSSFQDRVDHFSGPKSLREALHIERNYYEPFFKLYSVLRIKALKRRTTKHADVGSSGLI